MANGDVILDASGNEWLDSSGNIILDDGSGNCCKRQARKCSDGSLSGLWLPASSIPSFPYYVKRTSDSLCYRFEEADLPIPCPGTLLGAFTSQTDCTCSNVRQARKCSDNSLSGLWMDEAGIPAFPYYVKRTSSGVCYYFLSTDAPEPLGTHTLIGAVTSYGDCSACNTTYVCTPIAPGSLPTGVTVGALPSVCNPFGAACNSAAAVWAGDFSRVGLSRRYDPPFPRSLGGVAVTDSGYTVVASVTGISATPLFESGGGSCCWMLRMCCTAGCGDGGAIPPAYWWMGFLTNSNTPVGTYIRFCGCDTTGTISVA
jgi:hypothetical protein